MTRRQIISEILTDFNQYENSGLIDHRSLNRWLRNELKRFGANIMTLTEKVVEVENGEVELPEEFWSLYLAAKCNQDSHEIVEGCRADLQTSHSWKQRLETTYEWDNQSNSHIGKDYKMIQEKVYHNNAAVIFRYTQPILLKLTKGFKKESCAKGCKNIGNINSPYEINILGNKIQANFNKGFIYLQYYALPTDDTGDLYIPDIHHLEEYLIYYCKRKIMEGLWLNDDDVNLVNKMNYITQKEREYLGLAMTQVKFEALGRDWSNKLKRKMIAETNRYERLFPNT